MTLREGRMPGAPAVAVERDPEEKRRLPRSAHSFFPLHDFRYGLTR
jgi:hypothetical protein